MPVDSHLLSRLRETGADVDTVVELLIPGRSAAARELRLEIAALCKDLGARGALLLGPPGSGKSTIARAIALGRYLHCLKAPRAQEVLQGMRFDGPVRLDRTQLDWYEEVSLTGLVEELADSQLFGIGSGVATGVEERHGVFQRAMRGHQPRGHDVTQGASVTQGVVLLDEIGDLPASLQPKLLSVLTGAVVFMVGKEGYEEFGYAFRGLTLAATWRDISAGRVRPDLVSRLSEHVIRLPSLAERPEDIEAISRLMLDDIKRTRRDRLEQLIDDAGPVIDLPKLQAQTEVHLSLSTRNFEELRQIDWSEYGELRGLAQVLSRAAEQRVPISRALEQQRALPSPDEEAEVDLGRVLLQSILATAPSDAGFVGHVRTAEKGARDSLAALLRSEPPLVRRLADHLSMDPTELRRRIADLTRRR